MSHVSPTTYPPAHWTFMAQVINRRMDHLIKSKKVVSEDIPLGVYGDSKKFFNIALPCENYSLDEPKNREVHYILV